MRRRGIAFLNPPGFNREAHVSWDVGEPNGYGHFVISDCSRKVSLELPRGDDTSEALYKLDALIGQAQRCRAAIVEESR